MKTTGITTLLIFMRMRKIQRVGPRSVRICETGGAVPDDGYISKTTKLVYSHYSVVHM